MESQNKKYENKRHTHTLVDLERRVRRMSWGNVGTATAPYPQAKTQTEVRWDTVLLGVQNNKKKEESLEGGLLV